MKPSSKLKQLKKKYTYREIAEKVKAAKLPPTVGDVRNVTPQHVCRWLKGSRNPDKLIAGAIDQVFDRDG